MPVRKVLAKARPARAPSPFPPPARGGGTRKSEPNRRCVLTLALAGGVGRDCNKPVANAVPDLHVKFLRQNQTGAERLLWHQLRRKRVGHLRFRRQYRLGSYIVDFVCLWARLIVEVDGPHHDLTFENDQRRTRWLESQGFRVIRFSNDDVMGNLEGVVRRIEVGLSKAATKPRCIGR